MIEYRGYHIKTDPSYPSMKRVEAIGRGSVHLHLRGLYTNETLAKKAIDFHKGKEEVDG